jgi:hypothetical protein
VLPVLHGEFAIGEVVVVVSHETIAEGGPGEKIDGYWVAADFLGVSGSLASLHVSSRRDSLHWTLPVGHCFQIMGFRIEVILEAGQRKLTSYHY